MRNSSFFTIVGLLPLIRCSATYISLNFPSRYPYVFRRSPCVPRWRRLAPPGVDEVMGKGETKACLAPALDEASRWRKIGFAWGGNMQTRTPHRNEILIRDKIWHPSSHLSTTSSDNHKQCCNVVFWSGGAAITFRKAAASTDGQPRTTLDTLQVRRFYTIPPINYTVRRSTYPILSLPRRRSYRVHYSWHANTLAKRISSSGTNTKTPKLLGRV
ncbi:hypothetical protein F5Y14DRAFT_407859 [Nemania sp. NC0429]|nr:hypothetical protein F5Y14DRAFT_407859 [Nemania sp. NC0429]